MLVVFFFCFFKRNAPHSEKKLVVVNLFKTQRGIFEDVLQRCTYVNKQAVPLR